jgi:hypothetical protein
MKNMFLTTLNNDSPEPFEKYFQDSATSTLDSITDLHDSICYWLILVVGLVFTFCVILIYNYHNNIVSYRNLTHGTVVELI